MQTNILIKTDVALRDAAKEIAAEIGVPLTTVMNALLKQFVRDRQVTLTSYPTPKESKLKEWAKISREADKHPESTKSYSNVQNLIRDLKLR